VSESMTRSIAPPLCETATADSGERRRYDASDICAVSVPPKLSGHTFYDFSA